MLRRALIVVLACLATAGPAAAGTIVVHLTFTPGKLLVQAPAATATASGAVQVPVRVADGRGSGAGWTLRVKAARTVEVTGVSVRCAAGSTCTPPRVVEGPSGTLVLRAARDSGMGVMSFVVTVGRLAAGTPATPLAFSVS